jgi:hypothetical protein
MFGVIFALLDPGPDMDLGTSLNPDPNHCLFQVFTGAIYEIKPIQ